MPEIHKLAVILFADIAGYTALMEKDEHVALSILNRFKHIVEVEGPKHDGQVVQFFGDGALLAFDNSSNAISCAIAMQEDFQATPQIPVRIGMHLGDVLFKNDNVFGNGVNIASRVESLGVPGTVLLSKVVRDQIKNKADYQLTSLGFFEFKNVEEPMEIYALANPGLIVPKRSAIQGKLKKRASTSISVRLLLPVLILAISAVILWVNLNSGASARNILPEEIRKGKVAVAVFNNFTNNPDLDALGNMASDLISAGLRELNVKTTSPEMMRRYKDRVGILPGNPEGEVSLLELTDVQYVLTGSYYQKGDSIQITSRLESAETGEPIHDFPAIWGVTNEKEYLIAEIRDHLKGYWAVKESDQLSYVNPPKYEAYQMFLECRFLDPDCFEKVLEIDSTFLLARIYLAQQMYYFEDELRYQAMSSYVKRHWKRCTEFEKNFFTYIESSKKGDYPGALDAVNRNYHLDPRDLDMLHHSAYTYLILNRPDEAVKRFEKVFSQYEIFKDRLTWQSHDAYFFVLNRLGRHKEVIDFAKKVRDPFKNHGQIIRALMLDKDTLTLRNRLASTGAGPDLSSAHMYNALLPADTNNIYASLVRDSLSLYQDPKRSWNYFMWSHKHLYNWDSEAYAYYVLKEWEKTEKILLGLRNMDWYAASEGVIPESVRKSITWHMNVWVEGLLGSTYARQGKTQLAHAQIEKLESFRPSKPKFVMRMHRGVINYYQARIYALLGKKEKAVASLTHSMQEGRAIEYGNFVYDWDLVGLQGYQPYEELVSFR